MAGDIETRSLDEIYEEALKEGGKFVLSGLTPYCREVISITHLDELWSLYETADEAVKALA